MIPCKKVAVKAVFAETSIFKCHTSGIGIASITAPVTTLGMAIYCALANTSMHLPLGIDLSHAKAWGEHWEIAVKVFVKAVAMTTKPTK